MPHNGQCITCTDNNCIRCSPEHICSVCRVGYSSSSGRCEKCSENCLDCSGNGCTVCEVGYSVMRGVCVECLLGCSLCSVNDYTNCLACEVGYYNNSGICSLCDVSCAACSSLTSCSLCANGYTLVNNLCSKNCIFPCSGCLNGSPNLCTDCFGGYVLSNNNCLIDEDCNISSNCEYCPRKYYLFQHQCLSCSV